MKNLFLSLALMLIGSIAFASNQKLNVSSIETKTHKVQASKVMDLNTFVSTFDVKNIDKSSITFDVLNHSFTHTDSCGNTWTVTYWGYSFGEVLEILWELDSLLCWLA